MMVKIFISERYRGALAKMFAVLISLLVAFGVTPKAEAQAPADILILSTSPHPLLPLLHPVIEGEGLVVACSAEGHREGSVRAGSRR